MSILSNRSTNSQLNYYTRSNSASPSLSMVLEGHDVDSCLNFKPVKYTVKRNEEVEDILQDDMDEFECLGTSRATSSCSLNSTSMSDIWILPTKKNISVGDQSRQEDETLFVNYSDIDGMKSEMSL